MDTNQKYSLATKTYRSETEAHISDGREVIKTYIYDTIDGKEFIIRTIVHENINDVKFLTVYRGGYQKSLGFCEMLHWFNNLGSYEKLEYSGEKKDRESTIVSSTILHIWNLIKFTEKGFKKFAQHGYREKDGEFYEMLPSSTKETE